MTILEILKKLDNCHSDDDLNKLSADVAKYTKSMSQGDLNKLHTAFIKRQQEIKLERQ